MSAGSRGPRQQGLLQYAVVFFLAVSAGQSGDGRQMLQLLPKLRDADGEVGLGEHKAFGLKAVPSTDGKERAACMHAGGSAFSGRDLHYVRKEE